MNQNATPQPNAWTVSQSATRFENKTMRLREDAVLLPNGQEMQYALVERGPAVIIVPITAAGEMVLIRQYRHPVRERCLEVPAGTARDAAGMSLEKVAEKELKEEVGGTWKAVRRIGSFFSNSSMTDEECHVFLATGVKLEEPPQREPGEDVKTLVVPLADAIGMVERGEMKTGPAALAVLLCVPQLRAMGLL
jgi:8-oxo-dGTP pyrophosphatase MutT (NUDIX family)